MANLACRCNSTGTLSVPPGSYFLCPADSGHSGCPGTIDDGGPSPATSLQSLADLTNPLLISSVLDRDHPNLNIVSADYVKESGLVEAIKNLTVARLDIARTR